MFLQSDYQSSLFDANIQIEDILTQKLPTKKSENLNKLGQRIPMTPAQANGLYNVGLDVKKFARVASTYYKVRVSKKANTVSLRNETNEKAILIDFKTDDFDYMKITFYRYNYMGGSEKIQSLNYQFKKPRYNSDLFKIIIRKNLL